MDFIRKHRRFFQIIVILASVALILTSLLPLYYGGLL